MSYSQLTQQERYLIERCHQNGDSQAGIARRLGRDRSTVSRELARNSQPDGAYQAGPAQQAADRRASGSEEPRKLTDRLWGRITRRLRQYWSPQQIAAELAQIEGPSLSHEWIYQLIYADQADGGDLWRYLRHQRKARKPQSPEGETRGRIPDRTPISQRPDLIDTKDRFGDWEIDLVEGAKGSGYLLTLVERLTAFTLIGQLRRATAEQVATQTLSLLKGIPEATRSITCDNDKAFAGHQRIAAELECAVYFAEPYSPWQRGLNENTNGLLRQFFPKGCDMSQIDPKHLRAAMALLNRRPRHSLDYQTPQLLFAQQFP